MTVLELARKLNTTVSEIFEHYKRILKEIPEDENYVLTTEQIKWAIPKYKAEEKAEEIKLTTESKPKTKQTQFEDLNLKLDELRAKRIEILDNLEPYFKKGEGRLLKEILKHNSIPDLLLEGDYKIIEGNNFGFFKNISHQNGTFLSYPVSNDPVNEIFISSGDLKNGKRYSFEATIARLNQRTKKANPFLLLAKSDNIEEIVEFSAISQELKVKQERLKEIISYLEKEEELFEEKKIDIEEQVSKIFQEKYAKANSIFNEYQETVNQKFNEIQIKDAELKYLNDTVIEKKLDVEEQVSKVFKEKQAEANSIIQEYQKTINQKFNEIQNKEKELSSLNETVEETNNHLQKMENLLSTLKDRVSLCRNLQFISEDDEKKYLNLLSAKEFKPDNNHDFEKDFEKNFSKLADHIHAYLYHEKNLIYTSYQIKNFLTLLRTHDLIVLSGLSGSGKTQIVKAFAEALGGVAKIIPVKPNWTSSDDLIGYYNPLQMSFLPTPFTEAIVEAINNPNQLYLICLDEMNLARVEYYFADFLSKLEERNKPPEIELYAKHEEELFVSEFNTLLNLIESSLNGEKIGSWQAFLDNEDARKKFFEMLGNTDKESILQIHTKMKRRLIDILKFPSTIRIPDNVRFIGAINVDETTHYFSPKILDRIHVVKFDNPLLFEEQVNSWFENTEHEKELKPVYVQPKLLSARKEFPAVNNVGLTTITQKLKEINQNFLLPLNIDFGIRSIRQSLNYSLLMKDVFNTEYRNLNIQDFEDFNPTQEYWDNLEENDLRRFHDVSLSFIIFHKILPRFIFDGEEYANVNTEKKKIDIVNEFNFFLQNLFSQTSSEMDSNYFETLNEMECGPMPNKYLDGMLSKAKRNNSQFNFFA